MQRKTLMFISAYFFINIILLLIAYLFNSNLYIVEWMSLIQIVLSVIIVTKSQKQFLSVYNIFIMLTYLFHFGQALIRILPFEDILSMRSVLAKSNENILIEAELFAMLCIFGISMGYLLKKNRNISNVVFQDEETELLRIRKISITVLAVTFFPMLYIDFSKIIALSLSGYDATYLVYQNGIGKYFGAIGQFCKLIFPLLIFTYKNNKKKATIIMCVTTLYLLIVMFSGDRGTSVIYIVSILFVYFKFINKLKFRTVVIGVIFIYFMFGILSAISIFRYHDFSFVGFLEAYNARKGDGIIYSSLREFGGTMLSLVHSIDYVPMNSFWGMGSTYIMSILYISPWLPDFITNVCMNSVSYIHAFPTSAMDFVSLGGSYLGELYYNFGWVAPVFSIIIGVFIKKMDNEFDSKVSVRKVAFYIVLLPSFILWVRDFYVSIIFKTFWLGILLLYLKWGKNEKSINY